MQSFISSDKKRTKMKLSLIFKICFLGVITQATSKNFGLESNVIIDNRIANGEDTEDGEFPFQVYLQYDGKQWCGGSILNEYFVLTAAHCLERVKLEGLLIYPGITYLSKTSLFHRALYFIIHEKYRGTQYGYDIAIIRVAPKFRLSSLVSPVKLPERHNILNPGTQVTISGWGKTISTYQGSANQLQKVVLNVLPYEFCNKYYHLESIWNSVLCVGNSNKVVKGQCNGDSGGPVSIGNTVYGIVSFSKKHGDGSFCGHYPGILTSTAAHIDWIRKHADLVFPKQSDNFVFPV